MADKNPFPVNNFRPLWNDPGFKVGLVKDEVTEAVKEGLVAYRANKVIFDGQQFIKTFMDFYDILKDLSSPAIKVLCYIAVNLKRENEKIVLPYDDVVAYCGYKTKKAYYAGINELVEMKMISKHEVEKSTYWINGNLWFKGDRTKIGTDKSRKKKGNE